MTRSTIRSTATFAGPVISTVAAGLEQAVPALERLATSVFRATAGFVEVIQPVIAQLAESLARPNVQSQLRGFVVEGAAFVERVEAFQSPGYAPVFSDRGEGTFSSQFCASQVWHLGQRLHQQQLDRKEALKALHRLARRKRRGIPVVRDAELLRLVARTLIPEWFAASGKDALRAEFVSLLEDASAGGTGHRLFAIAAEIAPVVPTAKGRTPRFETSLHAIFLNMSEGLGGQQGYTYADMISDYTDEATAATRAELGCPRFNPTAGRQALKRALARQPAS